MIIPQPIDLQQRPRSGGEYQEFFRLLGECLPVVDLTETIVKINDWHSQFIEGQLGPHLSANGNRLVADVVAPQLEQLLAQPSGLD